MKPTTPSKDIALEKRGVSSAPTERKTTARGQRPGTRRRNPHIADKPNSRLQKYRLTAKGRAALQ